MGMKLVFISENKGVSQKTGKDYHMIKLADPITFENHTVSVDPSYISQPIGFTSGQSVEIEGRLATPYNNTQFLVTSIKKA